MIKMTNCYFFVYIYIFISSLKFQSFYFPNNWSILTVNSRTFFLPASQKITKKTPSVVGIIMITSAIIRRTSGWMASTEIASMRGLIWSVFIFDTFDSAKVPTKILPNFIICKKKNPPKLLNNLIKKKQI